jgi:hypothetical protein
MAITQDQVDKFEKQRIERNKMAPHAIQPHALRGCSDRYCWQHKDIWEHYESKINPSAKLQP